MKKLVFILVFVSLFAQETTHTVKPDDTLWDIANFYYQNPFLWPYIWRANLTKIEDPHWIYPDQVFVVPPAPEEAAPVAAVPESATAAQTVTTPEEIAPELPEVPETLYEEVTISAPPKKLEAEVITLVKPEMKIFSEAFVHRAGFIVDEDLPYWSKIIGTEPKGESNITTFKMIYIDRTEDMKAGEVLTIYRPGKIITDPETNKSLGKEIIVLGKAVIQDIARDGARCKVTASYDIIKNGDFLMPYEPILSPEEVELVPTDKVLEGLVAEVKRIGVLTSPNVLTYINKGENDGIVVGDIFTLYQKRGIAGKELPDFNIGEVQIISIFKEASIGLLLWHRETAIVQVGERCRLTMEAR